MKLQCLLMSLSILFSGISSAKSRYEFTPSLKSPVPQTFLQKVSKDTEKLVESARQGLVFVSVSKTISSPQAVDLFEYLFGDEARRQHQPQQPKERKQDGQGSGFIVDLDKGYILTNNHVVDGADEISLKLNNEKTYKGKIVGRDPGTDIAVVQITEKFDKHDIAALRLGDSDNLQAGAFVLADGAPFGLQGSASLGIVSAVHRRELRIVKYERFIQTDSTINPGNSGGPLLNTHGEVVGMNTAIFSKSGASNGIGFAIPSNIVRDIATRLINEGSIQRGFLGVQLQPLTEQLIEGFGFPKDLQGALIAQVMPDGPSAGKLLEGDVVTSVMTTDGEEHTVKSTSDLQYTIGMQQPKETVKLKLLRDGKSKVISMKLGTAQSLEPQRNEGQQNIKHTFGILSQKVTKDLKQKYQFESNEGVVITHVESKSPAEKAHLRPGDVVRRINGKAVHSVENFEQVLKSKKSHVLQVERERVYYFVSINQP
ncbi:MAG: trypsin-like peptidase domain-containing protein [Oligoflexales bacterium]